MKKASTTSIRVLDYVDRNEREYASTRPPYVSSIINKLLVGGECGNTENFLNYEANRKTSPVVTRYDEYGMFHHPGTFGTLEKLMLMQTYKT